MDYAIDKKEIIKIIFLGLAKPITGPFIIDSWAYNPDIKPREFNPQKAKEILKRQGWNDTDNDGIIDKNGVNFEFTITTNQGNDQRIKTAEIIQKRLGDIGIKVKIQVLEWSVFLSECVDKRNFDAVLLGWSLSFDPDPHDIWHSSKTREGEFNFIGYQNEEDKLIIQGRRIFDQSKRQKSTKEFMKLYLKTNHICFSLLPTLWSLLTNDLTELTPGPEASDITLSGGG